MDSLMDILIEKKDGELDPLEDYALLVDAGRHSSDYILYKPSYFANRIKRAIDLARNQFKNIKFKPKELDNFNNFYKFSNVQEIFKDPNGIYGYISVNNGRIMGIVGTCNRANEVRAVAARDGFGKLMYLIALAKEHNIMPNRDKVSKKGYEYWKDLYSEPNVDNSGFDNELGLHKKTNTDCKVYGDSILDRSYKTQIDSSLQLQPLINRHKVFLVQMKNFFERSGVDYIQSRIKEYIADAGVFFYSDQRGNKGWYRKEQ